MSGENGFYYTNGEGVFNKNTRNYMLIMFLVPLLLFSVIFVKAHTHFICNIILFSHCKMVINDSKI